MEETVVGVLTRGSELGFETPIKPHADLLFRILQIPDEPVVQEPDIPLIEFPEETPADANVT